MEALGYAVQSSHATGVEVFGDMTDAMRLNLGLRTGLNVLFRLREFEASTADDLYQKIVSLPWEGLIPQAEYLSVVSRVNTPAIDNTMFASLKVKDAVVDRIASKTGGRPNSGSQRDGVVLNLFWKDRRCWLYVNTSGTKLSDRGYRRLPHKAPLRETLAAGILMATGYDGERPLVLPMCGSGTLAIEAALMGLGKPPAFLRKNFGFMHLKGFNASLWETLRKEMMEKTRKTLSAPIVASDIDASAIRAAKKNAMTAGVDHLIDFHVCDFEKTPIPEGKGIVLLNPEYGERLGEITSLQKTYKRIGDFFKQACSGYTGYVLTGNLPLAKHIGLRPARRTPFYNAKIECRLFEYPLFKGSKRRREWKKTPRVK